MEPPLRASAVLGHRVFILSTLFFAAACGTSRSTRTTSCSNLKAVVDQSLPATSSIETYDPSAVLLLFKATSDKLTIESRCNARLVNKLLSKHKLPSGELVEATAPINFSQLQVQLETGESNLELHTSAHCFYRVWDSRVDNQVKNNPAIGVEPVRSLLRDMKTRYQLYRSMLTTPQTIVGYLPSGAPVSFKYKLQSTSAFEEFFAEVDKLKSAEMEKIVGREFSKTSVIMDELVLNECNSDDKIFAQMKSGAQSRENIRNSADAFNFLIANKDSKSLLEFLRTRFLSAGRHKLCFSQADMIVAPIVLTEALSADQKTHLSEIEKSQKQRMADFTSQLNGTAATKFVAEITETTTPLPTPAGLQTCSFSATHPGYSITDPFLQNFEQNYMNNWDTSSTKSEGVFNVIKPLFPNLNFDPSAVPFIQTFITPIMEQHKCILAGRNFDSATQKCGTTIDPATGRCPVNISDANAMHQKIKASIRLQSTSLIHVLKRLRDSSSFALTAPFASLWDYVRYSCDLESGTECSQAQKIESILSGMSGKYNAKFGSTAIDLTKRYEYMSVTQVDSDLQFQCSYQEKRPPLHRDISSYLYTSMSQNSRKIITEGIGAAENLDYLNSGVRFLMLKCVSAGQQRLYNDLDAAAGLLYGMKFADVSLITSPQSKLGNRIDLSNSEFVETGRAVRIPFSGLFFGESGPKLSAPELAARMAGGPHIQISYCRALQSESQGIIFCDDLLTNFSSQASLDQLSSDLQKVKAHFNFTTLVPNWLPASEKSKYGAISFPPANYSAESARYFLSAGDSGTTISGFGLWPTFMLSTVQDRPVSGGLAVIPSTGGQEVQSSKNATCR